MRFGEEQSSNHVLQSVGQIFREPEATVCQPGTRHRWPAEARTSSSNGETCR